ncbi:MAG: hypothetical protein ACYDGL_04515 [Bellilinea sp.]
MTSLPVNGFLFFAASLLLFLAVQRLLFRELQAIFLLLTRRPSSAMGLFSLLLFPGVFLHELSHFLMARLLGVRTGRFSLLPKVLANGNIRLGYVETSATDPLRDTLIGAAPLISGMVVVSMLMIEPLGILPVAGYLIEADWNTLWAEAQKLPARPDFWLWFYLAFAVSSTMLPSSSDRRAWWSIGLILILVLLLTLLPGISQWMSANLAPAMDRGVRAMAIIIVASGLIHLVLIPPAWLLRIVISRITGLRVV